MAYDVGLILRARNDVGEKRSVDMPKLTVLLENFENFEKKCKNPKYKNGTNVLSKEMKKETKRLTVHVEKGCLSDIRKRRILWKDAYQRGITDSNLDLENMLPIGVESLEVFGIESKMQGCESKLKQGQG